jgi:anti-anti-sigma regulatory factor
MTIAEARQRVVAGRGPGRVTIGVSGALEGSAIGAFDTKARAAMEPGMDVIVDLSEVTGMGSEGLAALAAVGAVVREDEGSFSIRPPLATKGMATGVAGDLAALSLSSEERARLAHPAGRWR